VKRDEVPNSLQTLNISELKSRILVYCEVTVIVWMKGEVDIGVSVLACWYRL
jgi:hypothetical protein